MVPEGGYTQVSGSRPGAKRALHVAIKLRPKHWNNVAEGPLFSIGGTQKVLDLQQVSEPKQEACVPGRGLTQSPLDSPRSKLVSSHPASKYNLITPIARVKQVARLNIYFNPRRAGTVRDEIAVSSRLAYLEVWRRADQPISLLVILVGGCRGRPILS